MEKLPFIDPIGLGGIALTIVLLVLDKAGKLKGGWLLALLCLAGAMTLFIALGNSWVMDSPEKWRLWRGALMVCFVALTYSGLALWIGAPGNTEQAEFKQPAAAGKTDEAKNSPEQPPSKLKRSLKQRTFLLANALDEFDQNKRNGAWEQGILGHEQEPNVTEKSKRFDDQTKEEFRARFGKSITEIRNEFHAKGVNVMNVPTVDEYVENWNWNGQSPGAYRIAADFAGYLRKLAEQIDEQSNLIH